MYVFAEPMSEDEIDTIQNSQKAKVAEYERSVMGIDDEEAARKAAATAAKDALKDIVPGGDDEESFIKPSETTTSASSDDATEPSMNANNNNNNSNIKREDQTIEENLRPLLAMTLTVRSRVNGRYVERPTNLTPQDRWTLEYSLAEIGLPSRAWGLYEATKDRRRKIYDKLASFDEMDKMDQETSPLGSSPASLRFKNEYIEKLREFSDLGRQWQEEMDRKEEGQEKVVVGEPYGKIGEGSDVADGESVHLAEEEREEDIEGVEDYMGWLYNRK